MRRAFAALGIAAACGLASAAPVSPHDALQLRNAGIPVYGVDGLFVEWGEMRLHGRDERLPVRSFQEGTEFPTGGSGRSPAGSSLRAPKSAII